MSTVSQQGMLKKLPLRRGMVFGGLIIIALLAFEIFNYSTTDYALADLLGDLRFLGIRWATILAIAFCGIDFAGIARLFTPEKGADEPKEVWYLFGAWLLAATMNAMLTWWGVSLAALNHSQLGNAVMERETLIKVVPIFVAIMVWLIRVLIIGTFSVAGERLFSEVEDRPNSYQNYQNDNRSTTNYRQPAQLPQRAPVALSNPAYRPAPKAAMPANDRSFNRPDPTYHNVNATASGYNNSTSNANNQPRQF